MEDLPDKKLAAYEAEDFKLEFEAELKAFAIQYWQEHVRRVEGMSGEDVAANLDVQAWLNQRILRSVNPALFNRLTSVDTGPVGHEEVDQVVLRTKWTIVGLLLLQGIDVIGFVSGINILRDEFVRKQLDPAQLDYVWHQTAATGAVGIIGFYCLFKLAKMILFLRSSKLTDLDPVDLEYDSEVLLEFYKKIEQEFFPSRNAKLSEILAYYETALQELRDGAERFEEEELVKMERTFRKKLDMWRGVAGAIEDIREQFRAECLRLQFLEEGEVLHPEVQELDASYHLGNTAMAVRRATHRAGVMKS